MPKSHPATMPRRYRTDIQGLRALAALLVAAYHIWFHRVSGAVDLFFFISAYFMTTSLLRRLPEGGWHAVAGFWRNLAKRLLPQAWTVLTATAVASILLTPITWWRQILTELESAALFTVNWTLAFDNVAYIHNGDTVSPVQHFWAMAVQMQVYLVWPLLIGAAIWAARRLRRAPSTAVAVALGGIALASLAYSVATTASRQPFAYYDTFSRVWEFCAGGLFALALPHLRLPRALRVVSGWMGVAGLVSFGFVADVSGSFPGVIAAVPLTFAALIFVSGATPDATPDRAGVGRWLSARPLMWLGGISYGIYLWHWPIMTLWLAHTGEQQLSPAEGLVVIAAAIGLAWLSTRFVEQPIRSAAGAASARRMLAHLRRPALRLTGIALALGLVVGMWQRDITQITSTASDDNPGASALAADYAGPQLFTSLQPALTTLDDQWAEWASRCETIDSHDSQLITCVNDPQTATVDSQQPRTIFVAGNSHADTWVTLLAQLAERNGWTIRTFILGGCAMGTGDDGLFEPDVGQKPTDCIAMNETLIDAVAAEHPDAVFTVGNRSVADSPELTVADSLVEHTERITALGVPVILMRDNPRFSQSPSTCLAQQRDQVIGIETCSVPRDHVLADVDLSEALPTTLADDPLVLTIDLADLFCTGDVCPPAIGGRVIYIDNNHPTRAYVQTLAPWFDAKFTDVLAQAVDAAAAGPHLAV